MVFFFLSIFNYSENHYWFRFMVFPSPSPALSLLHRYAMQPRHDRFFQFTEGYIVFDYYSPQGRRFMD